MLVFFTLGLGGELRSMTQWGGGGGGFDGDSCAMMVVATLIKRRRKHRGITSMDLGGPRQPYTTRHRQKGN